MDRAAIVNAASIAAYRQQPDGADPEAVRAYWRDVSLGEWQADRLGWSTGQAEAVAYAAADALVVDGEGMPRHVTGSGPGRRVAAGRIEALRAAGFLSEGAPDETGRRRIEATADGRRALMVWQRWSPAPVSKDKRTEREPLAPLHQGEEARRRAVAAERFLRENRQRRDREWAQLQARFAEQDREDALNAQWREANGIRNAFAKRPAGWTVEVQAEQDRAAAQEAAEAAAREAAHVCEVREPEPQPSPVAVEDRPEPAERDPYRYRYTVDGPQRAERYTGPLAQAEGRMRIDGASAQLTIRTHDAGRHGTARREAAEHLADGYGVTTRRTAPDPATGRVHRHTLTVQGDPLKVARFAADLPALLAAVEATATTAVRQLAHWRRKSETGQRHTERHSADRWRSDRRRWRRICIGHLARWVGPLHEGIRPDPGMPDASENWMHWAPRIAETMAHTIGTDAVRDHMSEALLFAKAVHPDESATAPAQVEDQAAGTGEPQTPTAAVEACAELTAADSAPQVTRAPGAKRVPHRPGSGPRIVRRRRPYGSISTRVRSYRPGPPPRVERRTALPTTPAHRTALSRKATRP